MTYTRLGVAVLAAAGYLHAADLSAYRGLSFGMSVAEASKQAGARLAEIKVVHQRPAVIQELEWRPPYAPSGDLSNPDPVRDGVMHFMNGELFRIVVTYDRYKVEGLTAEDLIAGISSIYGPASKPAKPTEVEYRSNYGESAVVLARWEDPKHSYNLVRTGDQTSFALVLYAKAPYAAAQAAIRESARQDILEAPQREIEKQQKRDDEARLLLEKARSANKVNFRP